MHIPEKRKEQEEQAAHNQGREKKRKTDLTDIRETFQKATQPTIEKAQSEE